MRRQHVEIVALNEMDYDRMGIYRIWFGWKFYIGSTTNSYYRIIQHKERILEVFDGIGFGWNYASNIACFMRQTDITIGFFEMVEFCKRRVDLVDAEDRWIREFMRHPDCLNMSYNVSRRFGNGFLMPKGKYAKFKRRPNYPTSSGLSDFI